MSRLGQARIKKTQQDEVTMGRVHSPGSTDDYSHSFVRIQYHAPVIAPLLNPSQSLLREAATAGLSAGLRTTASSLVLFSVQVYKRVRVYHIA